MKKIDLYILVIFVVSSMCIFLFRDAFVTLVSHHPFYSGFFKVAILATFGECLRSRVTNKTWVIKKIFSKFCFWGLFGIWFTVAFPFSAAGTDQLLKQGFWPTLPQAFSTSLWINLFSGFAPFMMFTHYWCDTIIKNGWVTPWELLIHNDTARWGKIVFLSLLIFWIPAHTFTFSLTPVWRILCAAYLSIALGFILGIAESYKQIFEKISESLDSEGYQ